MNPEHDMAMGHAWHLEDWPAVRAKCDYMLKHGLAKCRVRGCPNDQRTGYRDQLCWAHYQRLRKHGDVQAHIPVAKFARRQRR